MLAQFTFLRGASSCFSTPLRLPWEWGCSLCLGPSHWEALGHVSRLFLCPGFTCFSRADGNAEI